MVLLAVQAASSAVMASRLMARGQAAGVAVGGADGVIAEDCVGSACLLEASRAWVERFSRRWDAIGLGYWIVRLRANSAVIGVGGAERR